jgi:hypothetical protein
MSSENKSFVSDVNIKYPKNICIITFSLLSFFVMDVVSIIIGVNNRDLKCFKNSTCFENANYEIICNEKMTTLSLSDYLIIISVGNMIIISIPIIYIIFRIVKNNMALMCSMYVWYIFSTIMLIIGIALLGKKYDECLLESQVIVVMTLIVIITRGLFGICGTPILCNTSFESA